uniref:Sec-independent protein translocase-like protein n=1 Tax=Cyanidiococcus yangmingshanensis TaxID=2690220 RepID=A0A7G5VUK5_9RHOD|nr:sec-independent protein translocase-like protein [Cyanidiococcus yangmingshanensis]QMX77372.1 sec-independent protein translocase-like protein [Cyanidiococcus yangmingshanensis]
MKMPLSQHLEELRYRSLLSLAVWLVASMICFTQAQHLLLWLQTPAQGVRFLQLMPGEIIWTSVKVSLDAGLALSSPFIIYQIMRFIWPALTKDESRWLFALVILCVCLFWLGMFFSYFLLVPTAVDLFVRSSQPAVEAIWSLQAYIDFMWVCSIGCALVFQLPLLQLALARFHVINSQQMLTHWKYVVLSSVTVAALITPDASGLTQLLVTLVMILLYLLGILVLKIFGL